MCMCKTAQHVHRRGKTYQTAREGKLCINLHICTKCNPEATKLGPLKAINKDVPSVYVGESARSVYERAGEHWNAYKKRNTDC